MYYKGIVILQGNKRGVEFIELDKNNEEGNNIVFSQPKGFYYSIGELYEIPLDGTKIKVSEIKSSDEKVSDDKIIKEWIVKSRANEENIKLKNTQKKLSKAGIEDMTLKEIKEHSGWHRSALTAYIINYLN